MDDDCFSDASLPDADGDAGTGVVLQALFRVLTRWGSQLAVAVSTLAIAILLNASRRRTQSVIDRRFHRRNLERRSRT